MSENTDNTRPPAEPPIDYLKIKAQSLLDYIRTDFHRIREFMFASHERTLMSLWYLALIGLMSFVFSLGRELDIFEGESIVLNFFSPDLLSEPILFLLLILSLLTFMSVSYWFFIAFLSFLRPRKEWPVFSRGVIGFLTNLALLVTFFGNLVIYPVGEFTLQFSSVSLLIFCLFAIIYLFKYSQKSTLFKVGVAGLMVVFLIPLLFLLIFGAPFLVAMFVVILVFGLVFSFLIWSFLSVLTINF